MIHRDIVDDVVRESGKREKRLRLLPAHVVMYYVLALNLFFGEAYEEVMRQLVNGLKFLGTGGRAGKYRRRVRSPRPAPGSGRPR